MILKHFRSTVVTILPILTLLSVGWYFALSTGSNLYWQVHYTGMLWSMPVIVTAMIVSVLVHLLCYHLKELRWPWYVDLTLTCTDVTLVSFLTLWSVPGLLDLIPGITPNLINVVLVTLNIIVAIFAIQIVYNARSK